MNTFDKLPNDVVIYMALSMDLPQLLSLCSSSQRFNKIICQNDTFWLNKLNNDFGVIKANVPVWRTSREYYKYISEQLIHYAPDDLLLYSAMAGDLVLVKIAIQKGADVHYRDDRALKEAVIGNYFNVVRYLVNQGADVHSQHDFSLSFASRDGRLEMVKFLVENGATVDAWDNSALKNAVKYNKLDVVKYLISVGARIDDRTMEIAEINEFSEMIDYLKSVKQKD